MKYLGFATDYDGTLAHYGQVSQEALDALVQLQASGRKLILVTGRELDDLLLVFPNADIFDRIVAENGALLYRPATKEHRVLATPPPEAFVQALKDRAVEPISVGKVVVATLHPHEQTVLEVIRDLGLELQVIFNKGSVMVLPAGVNKASGLRAALGELGLSPHNVTAIGDAENDHAFLSAVHCGVAVAGALPMLKETADWVTEGDAGEGVIELISQLIEDDLQTLDRGLTRHCVLLGERGAGSNVILSKAKNLEGGQDRKIVFSPLGASILVAGPSGIGKTTSASALMERLIEAGYQICLIDPEGDYQNFEHGVVLGTNQQAPVPEEVMQLLEKPESNVVVNMVGVRFEERPVFFAVLLPKIQALRAAKGRPHWLVIDEVHHLFPPSFDPATLTLPQRLEGLLMITVHPGDVSPAVLQSVDIVLAVGERPEETLGAFAGGLHEERPAVEDRAGEGEVIAWMRREDIPPFPLRVGEPEAVHRRHRRKYAEGDVVVDRSFFFRGPGERLNLKAQNLVIFAQMAEGVDDDTWLHHLRSGDYSQWFREMIKDPDLAEKAQAAEHMDEASASRIAILDAIRERYTIPAGNGTKGSKSS